jgi:hypothetical protein
LQVLVTVNSIRCINCPVAEKTDPAANVATSPGRPQGCRQMKTGYI